MLGSRRLNLDRLIEIARSLKFSLSSGIMLRDAVSLLASRGTGPVRPVAGQITKDLEAGWSFKDALDKQADSFPPLFLSLVEVGEETGNLPEVMTELEKYYEMQVRLKREFVAGVTWPLVQFFAAIFIIAGLILVLGILPSADSDRGPIDPLGLGLLGPEGAVYFLGAVFSALLVATVSFVGVRRLLRRRAVVERLIFRIPVVGGTVKAMALTRFCVALNLVLESGAPILKTFRLSFSATDNAAFETAAPVADAALRRGSSVTDCVTRTDLFPDEFLSMVAVGEESGRLPEVLHQQALYYDELTRRKLALLSKIASGVVWLTVAAIIITAVIRIFLMTYVASIEKYT